MVGLEGLCWLVKGVRIVLCVVMAGGAITGGVLLLVMLARLLKVQESIARSLDRLASK